MTVTCAVANIISVFGIVLLGIEVCHSFRFLCIIIFQLSIVWLN